MQKQVIWGSHDIDELESPFSRGEKERNIRITFHLSSFESASQIELDALQALHELVNLPEIDAYQTEPGKYPHIEMAVDEKQNDQYFIIVKLPDGNIFSRIPDPNHFEQIAAHILQKANIEDAGVEHLANEILFLQAHTALGQDVFVTLSEVLLSNYNEPTIQKANPRTPSEALKIVGLFLRSRNIYTWKITENTKNSFDQGMFYWVLCRHYLPAMWKYFSACVYAKEERGDDILELGQSILNRFARALQARDSIGIQFFCPQNNNTRDMMIYHFDYLTLLLSGIFDAQSRVAYRAYKIKKPSEHYVSFKRDAFKKALAINGAEELYEILASQQFLDLMELLTQFRNTIHGAGLTTLAYEKIGEKQLSLVKIKSDCGEKILEATQNYSSPEEWGIIQLHELCFEPYSYTTTLLRECTKYINTIALATDVTLLFPENAPIPELSELPPKKEPFAKKTRSRLELLG